MSDKSTSGGPNVGLLLLVPAAAIVARAAMRHHRMMWAEVGGSDPTAPHGYGPHGHHAGHGRHGLYGPVRGFGPRTRDFRLPPRIEWMLDTWHTRAHEAAGTEAAETPAGATEAAPTQEAPSA